MKGKEWPLGLGSHFGRADVPSGLLSAQLDPVFKGMAGSIGTIASAALIVEKRQKIMLGL